jgi:ligand-binding sensor domain-containing protein
LNIKAGKPWVAVITLVLAGLPPCEFDAQIRGTYHHTKNNVRTTFAWDETTYIAIDQKVIEREIWVKDNDGELETLDTWQDHCLSHQNPTYTNWTNYTIRDGLAANSSEALAVAPDGTVWVGHRQGVSHFDSHTWTVYTTTHGLKSNWVTSISVAADGTVWVGTYGGGISRFDGNTWTSYTHQDGLIDDGVYDIAIGPSGALWIATDQGVSRFVQGGWTNYLNGTLLNAIAVAPDGSVWASSFQNIFYFAQKWRTYDGQDVKAIAIDVDGTTWVGYRGHYPACSDSRAGLARFDAGHTPGEARTIFLGQDGLVCNDVRAIAIGNDGSVWIGTELGVSHFSNGQWTTYTSVDGLIYPNVNAIAPAPDGSIWFATKLGVSHYTPNSNNALP